MIHSTNIYIYIAHTRPIVCYGYHACTLSLSESFGRPLSGSSHLKHLQTQSMNSHCLGVNTDVGDPPGPLARSSFQKSLRTLQSRFLMSLESSEATFNSVLMKSDKTWTGSSRNLESLPRRLYTRLGRFGAFLDCPPLASLPSCCGVEGSIRVWHRVKPAYNCGIIHP